MRVGTVINGRILKKDEDRAMNNILIKGNAEEDYHHINIKAIREIIDKNGKPQSFDVNASTLNDIKGASRYHNFYKELCPLELNESLKYGEVLLVYFSK